MNMLDTVKLDLPADLKNLKILSSVIEMYLDGVPEIENREMTVYNLQLAAQECCANMIDHAYAGEIPGRIKACMTVHAAPRRLILELFDTGRSVEPATLSDPRLNEGSERGYGLFLMHELMDEVTYSQEESGNRWQLVKLL